VGVCGRVGRRGSFAASGDRPDRAVPTAGRVGSVLQHPEGSPVKLALGAVLAPNEISTRLRYDANTSKGLSGSPCFDAKLRLVGLHHSGGPFYDAPCKPKYNQAIPIGLIAKRIAGQVVA
jgi:hypothetical protein